MNKSRYLLIALGIIVLVTVIVRYDQYVNKKDFLLFTTESCNPHLEFCFVAACSPEEDPECDITPYKKITMPADKAPSCLFEHTCENFICNPYDRCETTYCSENSIEIGEGCINIP